MSKHLDRLNLAVEDAMNQEAEDGPPRPFLLSGPDRHFAPDKIIQAGA